MMKNLITSSSPQALIDAYLKNHIFHTVVRKHEEAESSYQDMLEEAVALLVQDAAEKSDLALKYARKYGPIDARQSQQLLDGSPILNAKTLYGTEDSTVTFSGIIEFNDLPPAVVLYEGILRKYIRLNEESLTLRIQNLKRQGFSCDIEKLALKELQRHLCGDKQRKIK